MEEQWKPRLSGGVIPQRKAQPLNQWREVCRWDVEPSMQAFERSAHGPERGRPGLDAEKELALRLRYVHDKEVLQEAFSNMATAFEELAGEHRIALGALRAQDLLIPPCPSSPGWYWVRGHWRSRAQNSAAIDPDQGTVQAAPGEGQTGASGEATGHSPEGADPQIRDAYCRGRSGIPLGNWCNESQSGDATGADKEQPCPGCGSYRGTHGLGCRILALTQSGEERSE